MDQRFVARLLILLSVLTVFALVDVWRSGRHASRWKDYLFLLLVGCCTAVFGGVNDQLTCSISPEYFTVGKGIADGPLFCLQVGLLGAQAGFVAGVVGAALLLWAKHASGSRSVATVQLLKLARYPIVAIVVAVPVGILLATRWDPLQLTPQLQEFLDREQIRRFLLVWGIHLGLYVGGGAGCLLAMRKLWRDARQEEADLDVMQE